MNRTRKSPSAGSTLRRATALAPRVVAADVSVALDGAAATLISATGAGAHWLTRARRIYCLLAAIWVLNAFDLGFTVTASDCRFFDELNPIARGLIGEPLLLTLYKLILLLPCTLILATLRERRITELATWLGMAIYACVTIRWLIYYAHVSIALQDPAVPVETAMLASALSTRTP